MAEKTYKVTGMSCAACAAAVKKAVYGLDGVTSCDVNVATDKMTVNFDEKSLDFDSIKSAVEGAG